MPGTATLFNVPTTDDGVRRAHVTDVDAAPPTRAPVRRLLSGGGQPGDASDGYA
jgi:hypothetical protein